MKRKVDITVAFDLMQRVGLMGHVGNGITTTPAQLSPSEQYRLELVKASLESMQLRGSCVDRSNVNGNTTGDTTTALDLLPAPILLLDEWLDRETSVVVRAVQDAIECLCHETGAVVISVTHAPERWQTISASASAGGNRHRYRSSMTLCRGEILSFRQHRG